MLCRLCGRVPFQSNSPAKLEELIMQGELKFGEIEWINVSQEGMYIHVTVTSPYYYNTKCRHLCFKGAGFISGFCSRGGKTKGGGRGQSTPWAPPEINPEGGYLMFPN